LNAIEESGLDIDCESTGGVLTQTIEAENSKVVISRQPAMSQAWLAAKSRGYHLDCCDQTWRCTATGETFWALLNRACRGQTAGEKVLFNR
jgi:CyaY protein